MTKKSRTVLFLILLFLFIIIAPMIIFYAEGYRFDFENRKIIETGGIFIKTYPGEADIVINGDGGKVTSAFSRSAFIQNITPGTYNIIISKENYLPWEKNIEVQEKKVSEINVSLFLKENTKNLINEKILDLYKIDNGFIILKDDGFFFYTPQAESEVLINANTDWDDFNIINNKILSKKDLTYYLISDTSVKNFSDIGQYNFKIDERENFYYLIEKRLYKNNELIDNNVDFYALNKGSVYVFKNGTLFENTNKLNEKPIELKQDGELIFIADKIFLNENSEKLYLLDNGEFKKIINLNNFISYSEWDGKILFNDGENLWIYFSKDIYYPEFINENVLRMLIKDSGPMKNLTWINDRYFSYVQNDSIIASEFDFRDKINEYTLFNELRSPQIFFDYEKKAFYIFDEGNIYITNKITN